MLVQRLWAQLENSQDAILARFAREIIFFAAPKSDQKDFIASACLKSDVSLKPFLSYARGRILTGRWRLKRDRLETKGDGIGENKIYCIANLVEEFELFWR